MNSILARGKDLSLFEWMKVKFDDNSFLIMDFVYLFSIVLIIWGSYKKTLQFFEKHINKTCRDGGIECNSVKIEMNAENDSTLSNKSVRPVRRASWPIQAEEKQYLNSQQKHSLLTFSIFLSTLTLYNAVDVLGGLDQPETFFVFILCVFLVEAFMERKFEEEGIQLVKCQKEYELFYIMVNYMLSYMALCNVRKNRFWLNWFSMVLGMVGPCVLKLKREIKFF